MGENLGSCTQPYLHSHDLGQDFSAYVHPTCNAYRKKPIVSKQFPLDDHLPNLSKGLLNPIKTMSNAKLQQTKDVLKNNNQATVDISDLVRPLPAPKPRIIPQKAVYKQRLRTIAKPEPSGKYQDSGLYLFTDFPELMKSKAGATTNATSAINLESGFNYTVTNANA